MLGFTVAAVAAAVLSAPAQPAGAAGCVTIPAVAHRGGNERYVENTADAFRDATNRGGARWETDVHFTSDDVPVIMHDDTVDRTTDGTGPVSSFTYAQLVALRTADDQPIPTLAQIVNDAEVDGAAIYPELKVMPTEAQWVTFLAALASRPTVAPRIVVTSFDGTMLVAMRAHTALYRTALIQNGGDQTPASITQYAGTNILFKPHDSITAGRMASWTAGGITVYAWTVDTESEWVRMAWYPALAGVITNTPTAYLAWQKARAC